MAAGSKKPIDRVIYLDMGPWPIYVGVALSQEAFDNERRRLKIKTDTTAFTGPLDACVHYFAKAGQTVCIIAIPRKGRRSITTYAALIAHEAMHVVQEIRHAFSADTVLGTEAEAYLMQHIVQEVLALTLRTGETRRVVPIP